jgi:hypothetical protein
MQDNKRWEKISVPTLVGPHMSLTTQFCVPKLGTKPKIGMKIVPRTIRGDQIRVLTKIGSHMSFSHGFESAFLHILHLHFCWSYSSLNQVFVTVKS